MSSSDWVAAARRFLIDKGINAVKVEPIARTLGVTPGSFYWHFKNRPALYDELLRNWLENNVTPFFALYREAEEDPVEQYLALAYAWVLSPVFDPTFDVAVREWGRSSPKVNRLLRGINHKRLVLYENLFTQFGHSQNAAAVRARAMYYHQIGYYAIQAEDTLEDRLLLIPHYAQLFTGVDIFANCKTPEEVRFKLVNFKRKSASSGMELSDVKEKSFLTA